MWRTVFPPDNLLSGKTIRDVQMDDLIRRKIEEIMARMECPKGFTCVHNEFERLCKARDIGLDGFLHCLESHPELCKVSLPFSFMHLCHCTLRLFIAKKIGK